MMPIENWPLHVRAMNWQFIAFASICGMRKFAWLN